MNLQATGDVFTIDTNPSLFAKYPGLSSKDALSSLYYDILNFKNETFSRGRRKMCRRLIWQAFHHSSRFSTFSWIPCIISVLIVVNLMFFTFLKFIFISIGIITALNVLLNFWDNYLRNQEFENRINFVLRSLKKIRNSCSCWYPEKYPDLYTPHSPAVSLQWTIRDGRIVSLPCILLVKEDIIIMRPGHVAPTDAETVLPSQSPDNKYNVLITDQLLDCDPTFFNVGDGDFESAGTKEHNPIADRLYKVTKAPYVSQLRAVNNTYLEKPNSLYDNARHLLFGKCLHHVLLPFCLILCELLAWFRWYFFHILQNQHFTEVDRWVHFFVLEIAAVLIPLISPAFPLFWFICNAVGNANLLSKFSDEDDENDAEDYSGKDDVKAKKTTSSFFFDDTETCTLNYSNTNEKLQKRKFLRYLMKFFLNNGYAVVRLTNLLHTMASVTVLCCVDKKGILSFPNPIAEKVFFMKNESVKNEMKDDSNCTVDYEVSNYKEDVQKLSCDSQFEKAPKLIQHPAVEILDITPRDERGSAWKIEFDDSHWREHLSSLKPIGLAILLNTCNRDTHKSYNHFCAHITSHALQNKHLIPVANRRCLCELARQIGFHESSVTDRFNLELQLFTYKSLADNKYVQALFKNRKQQFPFPHAMSVLVDGGNNRISKNRAGKERKDDQERERKRKRSDRDYTDHQMFTQGTADVILDYCIDYWDGSDVRPLTPAIRKKILDFFQRSSLTAYCTAFSYRPVYKSLHGLSATTDNNSAVYLELLRNLNARSRQRRRLRKRTQDTCSENESESHHDPIVDAFKEPFQCKPCKKMFTNNFIITLSYVFIAVGLYVAYGKELRMILMSSVGTHSHF